MLQKQKWAKSCLLMGAVAVAGLMPVAGFAQDVIIDEEIQAINNGNISLSVSADVTNEYWFRGISQGLNTGVMVQPSVDIAFDLGSVAVGEEDIAFSGYVGTWNTFSSNGGAAGWYEADIYVGLSIDLPMNFTADVAFVALEAPGAGGEFAQEIDLSFSYDDSQCWSDAGIEGMGFAGLQPYILFAFETAGGSDFGTDQGIYMELGIEPSFTIVENEDYPVTLAVPVAVGLSLSDYYETSNSAANAAAGITSDETFGFVSVGLGLSVPLAFVPAEYGTWEAGAGLTFLILGDGLKDGSEFNAGTGDDSVRFIASAGVSMSY